MISTAMALLALLAGCFGFANALRRRVKLWTVYAILWAMVYVAGHIVIAWIFPGPFSIATNLWTLSFVGISLLGLWMRGGWPLDLAAVSSTLPEEEYQALLDRLDRWITRPAYATAILARSLGREFFPFLRKTVMTALIIGLFFTYIPPTNSWFLFWTFAVSLAAFAVSGAGFNWARWRKTAIASMILCIVLLATAPVWRSFIFTMHNSMLRPATSRYAVTTQDTTGWSGSRPTVFRAGTWLYVVDPVVKENAELGIDVVLVRPALTPSFPRAGFSKDEFEIVAQDIERRSSFDSSAPPPGYFATTPTITVLFTALIICFIGIIGIAVINLMFGKKTAGDGQNAGH